MASRLQDVLQVGIRADQPAATDVAFGTLYAVSDEDYLIEQSDGATWNQFGPTPSTDTGITQLTGDVTAGPGNGSQAATIANNAVVTAKILNANVTYAKIQNVTDGKLLGNFSGGAAAPSEYSLGAGLEHSSGAIRTKADVRTFTTGITVDGGSSVLTTGSKGFKSVMVTGTIVRWRLMADASGTIEFDIQKSNFAGFPPSSSIVASAPPSLSGAQSGEQTSLGTWTTSVTAGDVLEYIIGGSPATIKRVTLELTIEITG